MTQMLQKEGKKAKEEKEANVETEGSETTSADPNVQSVNSFKELEAILLKNGMRKKDIMNFMRESHKKITTNMIESIQNASKDKEKYTLLSKMTEIEIYAFSQ